MDKSDKPYELEHACCWRCCSLIASVPTMKCKYHLMTIEPNMFCNSFATSEEERKENPQ